MPNTNYATGGQLSGKLGDVSTTANFALNERNHGNNGSEWMYVYSSGVIAQYDLVAVAASGTAVSATGALLRAGQTVGIAQVAFATADYGWVALEGQNLRVNTTAAVAVGVALWTTDTAGRVDDAASTATQAEILGLVLVATASGTSASSAACVAHNLVCVRAVVA